jgi:CSLREA domain-containing protein
LATLAVLAAVVAPSPAFAQAPTTPTTFADGNDENCTSAHCTLREALFDPDVSVVNLQPGTYELTIQTPMPTQGVKTVNGAGATIDGNNVTAVLHLQRTANATINDVTITGGSAGVSQPPQAGGAIYAESGSILRLNRTTIAGNRALGDGGGIFADTGSTLELVDTAVVGNNATSGGGIASAGMLSVTRSTVSGNRAEGVQSGGVIGGVYVMQGGAAEIRNTTVSGNSASATGGGIGTVGRLVLENVTVAYNRAESPTTANRVGGVVQGTSRSGVVDTTLDNTLIARNTGAGCGGDAGAVDLWKGDHNLDDDGTCGLTATGDRPSVDPLIGDLAANGGLTQTHALAVGSPAIGAGADCSATDQRGAARSGACDIGAFEYVPPPLVQPGPPPMPPEDDELPPPVIREKVNMIPARGTIRVKRPGARRFQRLAADGAQLPVGTTVDARNGRVRIVAASDDGGGTDTAVFYGGIFKISQTKGRKPTTQLALTEKLSCGKAGSARIAAKGKRKRRLWGDGSGKFRTKGKHSAATVVGTKWLVEDRCASTLTRVVRGRVKVRDFAKKKTITLRRGKRYIARAG